MGALGGIAGIFIAFDIDKRNFTIVDVDEDGHKLQQYNRLLFCDSKNVYGLGRNGNFCFNQVGTSLLPNTDFR